MRGGLTWCVWVVVASFAAAGGVARAHQRHNGRPCGAADLGYDALPVTASGAGAVSGDTTPTLTIDSAATDCETTCKQEGSRVFRRCRMDGKEAESCSSLAAGAFASCMESSCGAQPTEPPCSFACRLLSDDAEDECRRPPNPPTEDCGQVKLDAFNDCLAKSCGLEPAERSCELRCRQSAAEAFQVCLDAGGLAPDCAARSVEVGDLCLVEDCDQPGADNSCVHACHATSALYVPACLAEGGNHDSCARAARDLLGVCLKEACGAPAADTACAGVCHASAKALFEVCRAAGLSASECAFSAGEALRECLRNTCGTPPTGPSCSAHCNAEANEARRNCEDENQPPSLCIDEANVVRAECVLDDCQSDAGCGNNCPRVRFEDFHFDSVLRRTDAKATVETPVEPILARSIELIDLSLGVFKPADPQADRFSGTFQPSGQFVRMDLRVSGVVNPPGRVDPAQYAPFFYGPRPIYGFIEMDVDDNPRTGGEIDDPEHRFLANVARFGGNVADRVWRHQAALSARALDGDFATLPHHERHGEEFHLAFLGGEAISVVVVAGDDDATFEAGETWVLRGAYFHRAHGFEPYSLASGGQAPGRYMPPCDVRFRHNIADDTTQISLVFPLTNLGAAMVLGQPPQPANGNPSDQASIVEGLVDLRESAEFVRQFPTSTDEEVLIVDWAKQDPADYLDPTAWKCSAILGTVHALPRGDAPFIWTDTWPNVLPGDADGTGTRDAADHELLTAFLLEFDEKDGVRDGMVALANSSRNFHVLDVNYDGVVGDSDARLIEGDVNRDGRVDLRDAASMQRCVGACGVHSVCELANFDENDRIDLNDFRVFGWLMGGP